jgi:NADH-quinone oxidoreductase subunit A
MIVWFVSPPIVFIVILVVLAMLARLGSRLACRPSKKSPGTQDSYACGESGYDHMSQPDYSSFFPFAFFFTIAHVAALILTTVPKETMSIFAIAVFYIIAAIVGLAILLRD